MSRSNPDRCWMSMDEKVAAACRDAGCLAIEVAELAGTEIVIWRDGKIVRLPDLTENQINCALSALRRFFEGDQFRSIDFATGEMMVEHRGRADEVTFRAGPRR